MYGVNVSSAFPKFLDQEAVMRKKCDGLLQAIHRLVTRARCTCRCLHTLCFCKRMDDRDMWASGIKASLGGNLDIVLNLIIMALMYAIHTSGGYLFMIYAPLLFSCRICSVVPFIFSLEQQQLVFCYAFF